MTLLPTRPRCTPPDFASFDAAISTSKITVSTAWREYAATAPRPYSQFTFIRLYRQWQAGAAVNDTTEFKASEIYWHGRASPRPAIIVLDNGDVMLDTKSSGWDREQTAPIRKDDCTRFAMLGAWIEP
jgi:hypothetical protein